MGICPKTVACSSISSRRLRTTHHECGTHAVFYIYRDWSRSRIKSCNPKNQIWEIPKKVVFYPNPAAESNWDKYHFFGTQLWLRAHGSAEKNNRAWCARCMDHFERYWNICAKTACGRVHPVALVTASSRISRN